MTADDAGTGPAGELADWAEDTLFGEHGGWQAFLREDAVARMWRDHREGRADHGPRLWMLIAWGLWQKSASAR